MYHINATTEKIAAIKPDLPSEISREAIKGNEPYMKEIKIFQDDIVFVETYTGIIITNKAILFDQLVFSSSANTADLKFVNIYVSTENKTETT